jgi:XrtN system VIT domain protein
VGIGAVLFTYYAIVLLPTIPFAIIGLILLGISIHLVVPLIMVAMIIRCTVSAKCLNVNPKAVLSGTAVAILGLGLYVGLYRYHANKIESAREEIVLNESNELPEWVQYAQLCSSEFWAKRIIGTGLLYEKHSNDWWGLNFNRGSFSEIAEHDPLVATAALSGSPLDLSTKEKVKVLSSSTGTRHYAYEKLWSGKDLQVLKTLTDVRLYPDFRMAYFEKTFWIENTNNWQRSQQEALFTFYLPEGAVASSLSLWIDGKEENSRLTTRKKATNAYKTIVGVESRDPVVLHWQEGNRLTATIFPCTPAEARRVKIGITAPLRMQGNQLVFDAMAFSGPDDSKASEIIHLKVIGEEINLDLPRGFKDKTGGQYLYNGGLLKEWQASMSASALSTKAFQFNHKIYRIKPLIAGSYLNPSVIYLDINREWEKDEVEVILLQASEQEVYVYTNRLLKLELANLDEAYDILSDRAFSLFPVHKIKNKSRALLITKGQKNSPIPSELETCNFHEELLDAMQNETESLPCLVIDQKASDYINSLNQYQLINAQPISMDQLLYHPVDRWYRQIQLDDQSIAIPASDMSISCTNEDVSETVETGAPSHLLRLYNYHSIIRQAGHLFLTNAEEITDDVYRLCDEAFVVSPVSSLIVLETQKDYERFDIDESVDSLKNANLKDSGAVPEPHEWALIALVFVLISFFYFKFR